MNTFKCILIGLLFLIQTSTLFAQAQDFVGCWQFNGNVTDESENQFNGTIHGSPNYVNDRYGNPESAIELDGVDDYISIPHHSKLSLLGKFSISFWIKPYGYGEGGYGRIIEKRHNTASLGYQINLVESSNSLKASKIGDESVSPTSCIELNEWQMYIITFDGSSMNIFKNGTLIKTQSFSYLVESNVELKFGNGGTLNRAFYGCIDDIYFYDREITGDEIGVLYSGGSSNWTKTSNDIIYMNGNVGIGTQNPTEKLSVDGTILAKEVRVSTDQADWPDFVFSDTYKLKDLTEVETFIKTNKHLENIPSATEMEKQGVNLAEMNKLLLQKVEELTLYAIEKDKEIEELKADRKKETGEREKLEDEMETMAERLAKIEALLQTTTNSQRGF